MCVNPRKVELPHSYVGWILHVQVIFSHAFQRKWRTCQQKIIISNLWHMYIQVNDILFDKI